jgi:hypothetical protein
MSKIISDEEILKYQNFKHLNQEELDLLKDTVYMYSLFCYNIYKKRVQI